MIDLLVQFGGRVNSVVVGLDPRWKEFPEKWQAAASADRSPQATAVEIFCRFVLRAVADLVPAVKIQCAFFEYLGIPGLEALSRIIAYARKLGLLVIVDAKRGDIGSTSEAYAEAFLAAPEKARMASPRFNRLSVLRGRCLRAIYPDRPAEQKRSLRTRANLQSRCKEISGSARARRFDCLSTRR